MLQRLADDQRGAATSAMERASQARSRRGAAAVRKPASSCLEVGTACTGAAAESAGYGLQDQDAVEAEAMSEEERLQAEAKQDDQQQQELDKELQHIEEQAQVAAEPLAPQLEAAQQAKAALEAEINDLRCVRLCRAC